MMPPVKTKHTNLVVGEPLDWDAARQGEFSGLPVHLDTLNGVMHSFWQPTEQDIANILAGMPIRLSVFGEMHPPVAVAVTNDVMD
ncbi:hypothetical protein [Cupriavidus sp. D39]|uniref:hypothetical protein n=1 Tax=Cupriavidus sp. D39 TaxID=2997877 RepID=UPI00226F6AD6|nr:hypothetical protein [Cupriavidus sp. D39]MCY0858485.1 hypothetical protein [Cupriavidus sp. D39]